MPKEPLDLTPEQRLELTDEIIGLLSDRHDEDLEWQRLLDAAFFAAIFDHDKEQPYFLGPDGCRYFGFKIPVEGTTISPNCLEWVFDELIMWGAGAAILTPEGEAAYVFSPGDIVSLYLYRTTQLQWAGGWGEEADVEAYMAGGNIMISPPNKEMLSPMVARCVDFYLTHYFSSKPNFVDRTPGIIVIRHESHTKPEDASDLVLNVYTDDFPEDEYEAFFDWIWLLFPRHLRKRLVSTVRETFEGTDFKSLREIYEEAGLEAIPKDA